MYPSAKDPRGKSLEGVFGELRRSRGKPSVCHIQVDRSRFVAANRARSSGERRRRPHVTAPRLAAVHSADQLNSGQSLSRLKWEQLSVKLSVK